MDCDQKVEIRNTRGHEFSLTDIWVHSYGQDEELAVQPLVLYVKQSQVRLLRHVMRKPSSSLSVDVFLSCPTSRRQSKMDDTVYNL